MKNLLITSAIIGAVGAAAVTFVIASALMGKSPKQAAQDIGAGAKDAVEHAGSALKHGVQQVDSMAVDAANKVAKEASKVIS